MNIEELIEHVKKEAYRQGWNDCLVNKQRIDVSIEEEIVELIIRVVRRKFNLSMEVLQSKTRKRKIVFPRQLCMYLIYTYTKTNLLDIGRKFGGRDHTTVIHAKEVILDLIDNNNQESKDILEVKGIIEQWILGKIGIIEERKPRPTPVKKTKVFIEQISKKILAPEQLGLAEQKKQTPIFNLTERPAASYTNISGHLSTLKKLAE